MYALHHHGLSFPFFIMLYTHTRDGANTRARMYICTDGDDHDDYTSHTRDCCEESRLDRCDDDWLLVSLSLGCVLASIGMYMCTRDARAFVYVFRFSLSVCLTRFQEARTECCSSFISIFRTTDDCAQSSSSRALARALTTTLWSSGRDDDDDEWASETCLHGTLGARALPRFRSLMSVFFLSLAR